MLAAASLQPVLSPAVEALNKTAAQDGRPHITIIFGSSGQLARSVSHGIPTDLFLSANYEWIEWLDKHAAKAQFQGDFVRNRLVLVSHASQTSQVSQGSQTSQVSQGSQTSQVSQATVGQRSRSTTVHPEKAGNAGLLPPQATITLLRQAKRIAMADPVLAPAGVHATRALETLGVHTELYDRLVFFPHVRATTLAIKSQAVPLGFVYRSDVNAEFPALSILHLFPPVLYGAMAWSNTGEEIYHLFLSASVGQQFVQAGFDLP